LTELASLKEIRLRQDAQLKEIQKQRDVLTDLLKQRNGVSSITSDQLNNKLQTVERDFSQSKEEFETYKIEKKENERMLKEESEKLREEVLKVRSDNARLSGQVEYNNERAKIYNKNLEGYKKQIAVLEERNRGLSDLVARHERSVEALKVCFHL
jgi:chromosome segregation ATPase